MKKIFTVAIIGCGSRGQNAYGKLMHARKDEFKIVSLCDINQKILEIAKNRFEVDGANCFTDSEQFFKENCDS